MITTFTQDMIPSIVSKFLIPKLDTIRIFTFSGPLGTGKTTIIKEFLHQCGITETVTSPTFTYVNTYTNPQKKTFYHFDLYRIDSLENFIATGFEELLFKPDSWCIIEWPGVIDELLNSPSLKQYVCSIKLDYDQNTPENRSIQIMP